VNAWQGHFGAPACFEGFFWFEGVLLFVFWEEHLRVREAGFTPAGVPKGFPLALWKPSESPFYTAGAREGLPLGTGK